MEVGQAVRYKGNATVVAGRAVEPGTLGEVVGVHRIEEIWLAVQWEGVSRPTFHLENELEPIES